MNPRLLIKPKNTIIQHVKKSNQINYLDLVSISSTNQKRKTYFYTQTFFYIIWIK